MQKPIWSLTFSQVRQSWGASAMTAFHGLPAGSGKCRCARSRLTSLSRGRHVDTLDIALPLERRQKSLARSSVVSLLPRETPLGSPCCGGRSLNHALDFAKWCCTWMCNVESNLPLKKIWFKRFNFYFPKCLKIAVTTTLHMHSGLYACSDSCGSWEVHETRKYIHKSKHDTNSLLK